MIQIRLDKEKKYLDTIEEYLSEYDHSFIGEKHNRQYYVYALNKKNKLIGALHVKYFWDWVWISKAYYQDINVLQQLIYRVQNQFNDRSGIILFTVSNKRFSDFLEIGFSNTTVFPLEDSVWYFTDTKQDIPKPSGDITIMESIRPHERYQEQLDLSDRHFKEQHQIDNRFEEVVYIAVEDETFVGGVVMHIYQKKIYVHYLFIQEDYRGKDIGTHLMQYVEQEAHDRKIQVIELKTAEFQARTFYEKLGYDVIHTMEDYPKGFECYTMIKIL